MTHSSFGPGTNGVLEIQLTFERSEKAQDLRSTPDFTDLAVWFGRVVKQQTSTVNLEHPWHGRVPDVYQYDLEAFPERASRSKRTACQSRACV
jgi:hypothetical protein